MRIGSAYMRGVLCLALFLGFICCLVPKSQAATPLQLKIGDISAAPGETMQMPVSLDSTGQVSGVQFDLIYDSDLLICQNIRVGGIDSDFSFMANEIELGKQRVIIYSLHDLTLTAGNQTIVFVNFQVKQNAIKGQNCELNLNEVCLSDADAKMIEGVIVADGQFTVENLEGPDVISPTIVNIDPIHGEDDVPVNKTIAITFSEPVQSGATMGFASLKTGNTLVDFTYSLVDNTLLLTPTNDLAYATNYEVQIPAYAVKDQYDNFLVDEYTYTFTTCSNTPGLTGDFNGDNCIDIEDISTLALAYGTTQDNEHMDLNGDGVVDLYDLVILARSLEY